MPVKEVVSKVSVVPRTTLTTQEYPQVDEGVPIERRTRRASTIQRSPLRTLMLLVRGKRLVAPRQYAWFQQRRPLFC